MTNAYTGKIVSNFYFIRKLYYDPQTVLHNKSQSNRNAIYQSLENKHNTRKHNEILKPICWFHI